MTIFDSMSDLRAFEAIRRLQSRPERKFYLVKRFSKLFQKNGIDVKGLKILDSDAIAAKIEELLK